MNTQTQVSVFLNTAANPPVTASPDPVPVPSDTTDTIQWVAVTPNCTISSITFTNSIFPFQTNQPPTEGNNWTLVDVNTNLTEIAVGYDYTITVQFGGQTYSSDPEIANEPPGGGGSGGSGGGGG